MRFWRQYLIIKKFFIKIPWLCQGYFLSFVAGAVNFVALVAIFEFVDVPGGDFGKGKIEASCDGGNIPKDISELF